ncbi:MAG: FtsB family cell division protein, partial [Jiangellaceae bacterium]
ASSSAGGRGRPSITGRAAVLALVLAVLMVSYAYPLRTWYEQHTQRQALEDEAAQLRASVAQLETELRLWDDPAYVAARARDRLGFVMPGEWGYVVVPDPDTSAEAPAVGAEGLPPVGDGTWYERLWSSVEAADATPPEDGP